LIYFETEKVRLVNIYGCSDGGRLVILGGTCIFCKDTMHDLRWIAKVESNGFNCNGTGQSRTGWRWRGRTLYHSQSAMAWMTRWKEHGGRGTKKKGQIIAGKLHGVLDI